MKKLFLTLLASAGISTAFAQVEIGLKISPAITSIRADGSANKFDSESAKFSFAGGVLADFFFGENYAFSSGLFLTGKGGTITYNENTLAGPVPFKQKIATQYLEVPATVKLFTNEVATDVRLFFQVGASIGFPIATRINDEKTYIGVDGETKASDHVFFMDANGIVGLGAEYQLGESTKFFGGFSYHRGLIDFDRYFEKTRNFSDVSLKNDVIALDLGLKF